MITIPPTFSWCTYSKGKATCIALYIANKSKATQAYDHPLGSSLKHITWTQHCLCPRAQLCALLYLTKGCAIQEDFAFQQHPTP